MRGAVIRLLMLSCGLIGLGLIGCRPNDDSRIVDLEKRIARLEQHAAQMERQLMHRLPPGGPGMLRSPMGGKSLPDKSAKPTKEQIEERQRLRQEVRKRIEERRAAERNKQ